MDNNSNINNPPSQNNIGESLYELLSVFQEIDREEAK